MKRKEFSGIAVFPKKVLLSRPTLVGVWLGRAIPPSQRRIIMGGNEFLAMRNSGKIGVRRNESGSTAVLYVGRLESDVEARKTAHTLSRFVRRVTGAQSILRRLPNYRAVSRALAD